MFTIFISSLVISILLITIPTEIMRNVPYPSDPENINPSKLEYQVMFNTDFFIPGNEDYPVGYTQYLRYNTNFIGNFTANNSVAFFIVSLNDYYRYLQGEYFNYAFHIKNNSCNFNFNTTISSAFYFFFINDNNSGVNITFFLILHEFNSTISPIGGNFIFNSFFIISGVIIGMITILLIRRRDNI
ncbi:MAG: hypothetical protein EAX96_03735 [Candidatus Lokiarchaeota archaeon]|nr:hypothetical protein [Candidatus Lokiarchaeota archaeon]